MAKKKINYTLAKKVSQKAALTEKIDNILLSDNKIERIRVSDLLINPYQPRISMNDQALDELAHTIEREGLLQPIIVSKANNIFTIIAGHRRVEAHKRLKKTYIDAIVMKEVVHEQLALLPLIENLQRENTHPIENAIAFKKILNDKIVDNQNDLSELLGLSKSWLSKSLSILKLPENILNKLKEDNYKDITVMSAMNKLELDQINNCYSDITAMSRENALSYIKEITEKKKENTSELIIKSKNKIVINIKDIDNEKIEKLMQEIESIIHK